MYRLKIVNILQVFGESIAGHGSKTVNIISHRTENRSIFENAASFYNHYKALKKYGL